MRQAHRSVPPVILFCFKAKPLYLSFAKNVSVTIQGNANVSAATSAGGLIKLTTSAPHGLNTGDIVQIAGVSGTVEANGQWIVSVIDSTHFTLNNSVFANAYVSGGLVVHIGHATAPVSVNNTVFPNLPSYALQARIEALSSTAALRVVFVDAVDSTLVTERVLASWQVSGVLGVAPAVGVPANADIMLTVNGYDIPAARLGQGGSDVMALEVYCDSGPGSTFIFSGWLSY